VGGALRAGRGESGDCGGTAYLKKVGRSFNRGIDAEAELAYGDPVTEIVKWWKEWCDLLAMSTHGHR